MGTCSSKSASCNNEAANLTSGCDDGAQQQQHQHQYIGEVFSILHRMKLPLRGGQGRDRPDLEYIYIKATYIVCARMVFSCSNHANAVEKTDLLKNLGLRDDMGTQTMYMVCSTHSADRQYGVPDPKCVRNMGTTKWISEKDLVHALRQQSNRHIEMI